MISTADDGVDAVLARLAEAHPLLQIADQVYAEDGPYPDPVVVPLGSIREFVTEVLQAARTA